jgi:hypothetical protein
MGQKTALVLSPTSNSVLKRNCMYPSIYATAQAAGSATLGVFILRIRKI